MSATTTYQPLDTEAALVTSVQLPIVTVEGFTNITPGEVVIFESGALGQVLTFTGTKITCLLHSKTAVGTGSTVLRTGKQLGISVHDQMVGHLYSPLGASLGTELTAAKKTEYREVDTAPPPLTERHLVADQVITGYSVVDLLLPIGQGQRELIVGDAKTGKSEFLLEIAKSQAATNTIVVYTSIGKQRAVVKHLYDQQQADPQLKQNMVIVASTAQDPVGTITQTPFTAMTVAEYFKDQGRNVLLILDDLSTHAKFYRELSLVARKFPGRDSYPGDIFYTHARLLERAGCFDTADKTKGVSITCLPVAHTTNSDLTDFIVSNLISITDGHVLFDQHLFAEGYRPAIDTRLSVTRVGKQTQTPLGRSFNRTLTSFFATYYRTLELTHFGTELSTQSQQVISRGNQLVAFFSDKSLTRLPLSVQLVLLGMVWHGWISSEQGHELSTCKTALASAYQDEAHQTLFDQLTGAESMDSFLEQLSKEQEKIRPLCKPTSKN